MSLRWRLKAAGEGRGPMVRRRLVNPSAFAERFLHHLALFSPPPPKLREGLRLARESGTDSWDTELTCRDYLPGFRGLRRTHQTAPRAECVPSMEA